MIDRRSARRRQTGETGAILPFLALGFVAIVLFLIMTVDVGVGYMARGQLQNIADAASRAALEFRTDENLNPGEAAAEAIAMARQMVAANGAPNADVVFGDFDFSSNTFRPGGMEFNPAVRVVASRMGQGGQGNNAIPGLLGDMDVMASSTAAFKCRAIVLVEDVTVSFNEELRFAQDALRAFVDRLAAQALPGDHIGFVTFNNDDQRLLDLTPVPQAVPRLNNLIDNLRACPPQPAGVPNPCDGTNQASGLETAIAMHEETRDLCSGVVDRLIVVVSDGEPCGETPALTEQLRARALALSADAIRDEIGVDDLRISVASVFYNRDVDSSCGTNPNATSAQRQAFSEQLATKFSDQNDQLGQSFVTPRPERIQGLLLDILKLFRVSVVG